VQNCPSAKLSPGWRNSGGVSNIVVCRYYPPGNVAGQFAANILAAA
jgi:hypothetical protein